MAVARAYYYQNGEQIARNSVTNPSMGTNALSMAIGFRDDLIMTEEASAALLQITRESSTLTRQPRSAAINADLFRPKV